MIAPLLLSLGIVYFIALGAGRIAAKYRIPRVTGYLIVGLFAGPSMAKIIGIPALLTNIQLQSLQPVHDLTLGIIVLVIGGSFRLKAIRKFGRCLLQISFLEISITAVIVGFATFFVGATAIAAGFFALMAITTAPAATQMVVREYEAEGNLTDLIMTLIGLNNLVAIVGFVIFSYLAITPDAPALTAVLQIAVPLGIGIAAGSLLALMDQRLTQKTERQILALATIAAIVGFCHWFNFSAMLSTLVAGAVLVNSSPHEKRILNDLGVIDYPLYVVFFLMAGAQLHLDHIPHMGIIGVAYIVARFAGKFGGCLVGTKISKTKQSTQTWLGPAMFAQAGLAIGLAGILAQTYGEEGKQIQTAILASVVIFEGIGPLLTRISLVRAGEVTVLSILQQRSPVGYAEGLHHVVNKFVLMLGFKEGHKFEKPSDILVEHIMRRNVDTIKHDANFNQILKKFGHSRYDRLPVVNYEDELIGVIQYSDVSEILFDPTLRTLIVAGDIATREHLFLKPNDNLQKAMDELQDHPDHTYLLVVDLQNEKKLIGVVRYNDVLSAQRLS